MPRIAYLGPRGTFSEEALLSEPAFAAWQQLPLATIPDVVAAVADGVAEAGIVPIENAIEGAIDLTLDALVFDADVLIRRELVRPISLNLIARPGTRLREIRTLHTIPVVAGQCREWLQRRLPGVEIVPANSTAAAVTSAARARRPGVAALGTRLGAELHGLEVLAGDIEDHPENATRFVVLGQSVPAPTGHDKTSIVVFQRANRPGSLLAILQEFAARSIDLTRLESRPTRDGLGRYCFVIDFEGHVADELVADALRELAAKHGRVKFLGSYPAADGADGQARRTAAGKAWRDAARWVDEIRARVDPAQ